MHGDTLKQSQFSNTSSRLSHVNMFASIYVIYLVPGELWNFLEARMQYDKCIENELWSYPCMGTYKPEVCFKQHMLICDCE